jgi:hypothetical protein
MPNKRTVDPTASEASSKIIGIRVTETQLRQLQELSEKRGQRRSQLIRDLVARAYDFEFSPEPF